MADPKPYERSYSFRAYPDDEQNVRQLGLLLDRQFDEVAGHSQELTEKVNKGIISRVQLDDDPGAPVRFEDGVLTLPRGWDGASVFETWLTEHPGGTIDQFLEDMRTQALPELLELLEARDQAVQAAGSAVAAADRAEIEVAAAVAPVDAKATAAQQAADNAAGDAAEAQSAANQAAIIAETALGNAEAAQDAADTALGNAVQSFPGLLSSSRLYPAGDAIITRDQMEAFEVLPAEATTYTHITAGGVKLHPRDPSPRTAWPIAYAKAVPLEQGTNKMHSFAINRGNGLLTFVWPSRRSHLWDAGAVLMAADSYDDGDTVFNVRRIYAAGGGYTPDIAVGGMFGNRAVILTIARDQSSGTTVYGSPRIVRSTNPDEGDWTGAAIALHAELPANFGAIWHQGILPWPAAEGGADETGWIAYCYSQGVIAYVTTVDNWTTVSQMRMALPAQSPGINEHCIVGSTASGYTMIIRANGAQTAYLSFAATINGPWSTPIPSGIELNAAPPNAITLSDREAYLFVRSGTATDNDPNYRGHLMVRRIDPLVLRATAGAAGYSAQTPFLNLGAWPSAYPAFVRRGSEWLMMVSGSEAPLGGGASHGGNSQAYLVSPYPSPALTINAAKPLLVRAEDNLLPNGSFTVAHATSGTPTTAETALPGWRYSRAGNVAGGFWERVARAASRLAPHALRFGRLPGDTETGAIVMSTIVSGADLMALRGEIVTFGVDAIRGADATGHLVLTVSSAPDEALLTSADGSVSGGTVLGQAVMDAADLSQGYLRRLQVSAQVPTDAARLILRLMHGNQTGTAGAADWYQVDNAFLVAGNVGPVQMRPPKSDDATARALRHYFQSWLGGTITQEAGTSSFVAASSVDRETVYLPAAMRERPGGRVVQIYSPVTGAVGKAAGPGGDVDAVVIRSSAQNVVVQLSGLTPGDVYRFHVSVSAQWW